MAKEKSNSKNRLGLFDHISAITEKQDPDYFKKITDEDKKTWSNYLILRYLSMQPEWTEMISEVQSVVQSLSPELFYKFFIDILPKKKQYLRYISGSKKSDKNPDWLVELMIKEFQVSEKQACDYLEILFSTREGQEEILEICENHAIQKKDIKSLKLKV